MQQFKIQRHIWWGHIQAVYEVYNFIPQNTSFGMTTGIMYWKPFHKMTNMFWFIKISIYFIPHPRKYSVPLRWTLLVYFLQFSLKNATQCCKFVFKAIIIFLGIPSLAHSGVGRRYFRKFITPSKFDGIQLSKL